MQNLVGKTSEDVLCEISKWRIPIPARKFHYCHITVEKKIIILLIKVDICRKNIGGREPTFDLFRHSSFAPFPANFHFHASKARLLSVFQNGGWRCSGASNLAEKFHVSYNRILKSVSFKGLENGQYLTRFISFIYAQESDVLSGGELVLCVAFAQNICEFALL